MASESKNDIENLIIGLYIILLIFLGFWLKDFFTLSWQEGLIKLWFPDSYDIISFIVSIIAGIYYGILIVTYKKDFLKRVQTSLLLFFSIIVTIFHSRPLYDFYLFFLISFGIAYIYADKQEIPNCRFEEKRKSLKNRPLAIILILTSFFMTFSLLNYLGGYYIKYNQIPDEIIYSFLKVALFTFVFYKFMDYEITQSSILVLGPARSGKTAFMAALCDQLQGEPNSELRDFHSIMFTKWPEPNQEVSELDFSFKHGSLFAKCIKVNTLDFPGYYTISQIHEAFKILERKKRNLNPKDFTELISKIDLLNELSHLGQYDDVIKLIYGIAKSDKLIFLISSISINRDDPIMTRGNVAGGEFKNYIKIYELIERTTNKPFMFVVNKVDKEYASKLMPSSSINDVGEWILTDIKKTGNTSLLRDNKAIKRRNSVATDELSAIFPCWIEEDNDAPLIENGKIKVRGYDEIIRKF